MKQFFSGNYRLIGILVLACAAVVSVIFLVRREASPFHALPSNAAVVVALNDPAVFERLKAGTKDPAWAKILQTALFRQLGDDLSLAKQLFEEKSALYQAIAGNRLLTGLTLNRADSLHGLFIVDTGLEINLPAELTAGSPEAKVFPSVYHGHAIYTVYISKQERLVFTVADRLLLFSRFSYLVEDAITQLDGRSSWWADRPLAKKLDPNAPLHILVRPDAIATAFEGSMKSNWAAIPDIIRNNLVWLGLSWDGRVTTAQAETKGFLGGMYGWGGTGSRDIFSILPDNTALLAKSTFSDPHVFFNSITDRRGADFEQFVLSWAGNEAAWVLTEPFSKEMRDDQFVVFSVRDSARAMNMLRSYGRERGMVPAEPYQSFEIFDFTGQSILAPLSGKGVQLINPACVMIGRYVVFGNSRPSVELWVDRYIVNQTLSNNTDFLSLQQKQPAGTTGAYLFLNSGFLPLLVNNLLQTQEDPYADTDMQAFSHTGLTGINLQPAALNELQATINTQQQSEEQMATSILWKTPLASPALTRPFVINQAGDRPGPAVLIQDAGYLLYRLDAGGSVIWKRQMEGPVLSEIHGIDFWDNQTTCYLFNTPDRIWLLDDKGEDIDGFPFDLQSPALNGVVAVDFDQNRKYNYFIACTNGNLYGYDRFGRPLPGWNPQGGVGRVVHPLLHFERGEKDYLAALNRDGKLFVFGRNGEMRFPPVQFSGKSFGAPQADPVSAQPRIVCANNAGKIFVCNLAGETFAFQGGHGGRQPAHLAFSQISGDARYEYAVAQGSTVQVSGYTGSTIRTIYSHTFPLEQDTVFAVDGHRIGTLNRSRRQIQLLQTDGIPHPDFPLAGTTAYSISDAFRQKGGQVLVVGDGSSVYAYTIR